MALFGGSGGTFTGGTLTSALLFSTDNTIDIGALGATRPRTGHFATSLIIGSQSGGTGHTIGQTGIYRSGRFSIQSSADGNIFITNAAETSFGLLQFGGTTSSFPALKRSNDILLVRLADDSANTAIAIKTVAGVVSDASFAVAPPDGTVALDSTNFKIYSRFGGVWKSVTLA